MKRFVALVVVLLALVAGARVGAQDKPLTKLVFALTTKDISVGHAAHTSLPQALGYWKDEGLDVTVASVEGSTAGAQQIASGNIQIVSVGPELVVISRDKGVKIKAYYVQARTTIYRIIVPADSPIKTIADLKGKTIGVPSLASGSVPFAKALVAAAGLDAEKDVKLLAVGVGAPGALAVQQKKVDALGVWDTLQAELENRGIAFRRVPSPLADQMLGQSLAASDDLLAEHPDLAVKFARGVAKATVFGLANPEAAIRIHWKLYPQSRPQGMDDATAMKEALPIFHSRFDLQRVDNRPDKRFGFATPAQWQTLEKIYREQKVTQGTTNPADLYTDKLVDQINKFDREAIVKQAKEYKF